MIYCNYYEFIKMSKQFSLIIFLQLILSPIESSYKKELKYITINMKSFYKMVSDDYGILLRKVWIPKYIKK